MKPITKIDREEVLTYLGYTGQELSEKITFLLEETMAETLSVCRPKAIYKIFPIVVEENQVMIAGSSAVFPGKSLAAHVKGCPSCALMACTLGLSFDQRLKNLEQTDLTRSILLDCCGSAYIEQVCDQVQEEILSQVQPTFHTSRFSPGYGDLPLSTQKLFQAILSMDKTVGITLTPDHLMIPRKSVTAILGFADTAPKTRRFKCDTCKLKDACAIRKAGKVCGR